jgi:hypothetical protein
MRDFVPRCTFLISVSVTGVFPARIAENGRIKQKQFKKMEEGETKRQREVSDGDISVFVNSEEKT